MAGFINLNLSRLHAAFTRCTLVLLIKHPPCRLEYLVSP